MYSRSYRREPFVTVHRVDLSINCINKETINKEFIDQESIDQEFIDQEY